MLTTVVSPVLLHAALIRRGVWLVDAKHSVPTDFYHKCCLKLSGRCPIGEHNATLRRRVDESLVRDRPS